MLDITDFSLFVISVLLLSITPGPDMAYVVGQSIANGRRAGVISAAGVALGSCTHALFSIVGLTALIAASPMLFAIVKYAGAAYLMYLGGRLILDSFRNKVADSEQPDIKRNARLQDLLSKGFITTLTNPKVLLFFVSFFPQFVVPGGEQYTASLLVLGVAWRTRWWRFLPMRHLPCWRAPQQVRCHATVWCRAGWIAWLARCLSGWACGWRWSGKRRRAMVLAIRRFLSLRPRIWSAKTSPRKATPFLTCANHLTGTPLAYPIIYAASSGR